MTWQEIRMHFASKWLLIEAIKVHSEKRKRVLDEIAVLDMFADSVTAMKKYAQLHHDNPMRELFVLHTDREKLDIIEGKWIGVRGI